ncbi:hypothetical protein TL16_g07128 [Triparma laevis f. inornata]|uniref:Uncharacterized protein n=1 Tax=Triparma laevis f. inornata TaxID=1714386 RepID=A0A9W7AY69_9STRA|nr:hypothetical protein TL16_g07128 [Triparma laevis f. inornata]
MSTGETIVQEVAAPREEVKATKYINGKLSSKTCHLDLDEGEFLVAVSGCVHTSEGLFTDLNFTTSSRKKADFRSACSSGSSDRFRKWTTGDLLAVDVWKFDARRRRADKDRETKGDVGVIGLRIAYVQTWGNMSGLGRIGAIVNRFVPVEEGAVEEWSEEMVLEKRRLEELEAADREEMLARNRSNKVKKGDYWRQNNVLVDETVMEGRDGFALGRGAGHLSYNELQRQQEKANVTRSNNRVEFEMFMEEYRSNSAQIDGLEAAKNFMELSPEKVRPKVSLEETGGLSFYDGEINQYGSGWGEEDVEGGGGEGNGKNGDNFDGEGDEIDEAVRQKIVQSSRALLRYALSNV